MTRVLCVALVAITVIGCGNRPSKKAKREGKVIGKTTQDIGRYDPEANLEVSTGEVEVSPTPLAAMDAYGPLIQRISEQHIDQAVRLFEAEHGRYPRDYDEFMDKIIKANQIELPVLPGNLHYQYDEENHRLVVVAK